MRSPDQRRHTGTSQMVGPRFEYLRQRTFVSSQPLLVWQFFCPNRVWYPPLHHENGKGGCSVHQIYSGWWLSHPSEKYESIGMMTFPIYGQIKVMFQSPPTSIY